MYVCDAMVEEPLMNFTFDMTVLNLFENVVETVSVYDKVAEKFIGLTPKELVKYLDKDKSLLTKLEEVGKGLYISAETFPRQKQRKSRLMVILTFLNFSINRLDWLLA
ncbi:hypothetical protein MFLAVUS_000285 [Mucor flavus]|uniref:Uncharacterized protein n=1 Tax=Mucor flavus TaxID=439312 RepID=A0ABP9YJ95_9FUNG